MANSTIFAPVEALKMLIREASTECFECENATDSESGDHARFKHDAVDSYDQLIEPVRASYTRTWDGA